MNPRFCCLLIIAFWGVGTTYAATVSPTPNLPVTSRGQSVVVYGDGFPIDQAIKVYLRTGSEEGED
jgi:hypothetical protein